MRKPKHTPGPWLASQDGDLLGPKTNFAGQFYPPDARIIAAAPEMLEALHTVHDSCGCDRVPGMKCLRCDFLKKVIAKAEGRDE